MNEENLKQLNNELNVLKLIYNNDIDGIEDGNIISLITQDYKLKIYNVRKKYGLE